MDPELVVASSSWGPPDVAHLHGLLETVEGGGVGADGTDPSRQISVFPGTGDMVLLAQAAVGEVL